MNDLVLTDDQSLQKQQSFEGVIPVALATVSESSARIYADTYRSWAAWALDTDADPLNVNGGAAVEFLKTQQVSATTRQLQLSALRKMAQVLAVLDFENPMRRAAYESMKLIRAPKTGATKTERSRRALTPEQVDMLLDVWLNDDLISVRNQALIAVMFASGARRAEIAALKWQDVDLEQGTIHIRHGKGDKERHAALFGDAVIHALEHWQTLTQGREYVFCPLTNAAIGKDEPITGDTLYQIVGVTGKRAGIAWKPHDARRTLITELLNQGVPLADVQQQVGHAQGNTTLGYAQAGDAAARRKRVELRYGR